MNLNSVPTPHLSLPRLGAMGGTGRRRHGAGGRVAAETRWRWGTRFLNVHFMNIGYSISGIGRMQEGLQFFLLPGRGKILESHGGFEGRQIVAADGEDETVGGFHSKATLLRGKNPLDMVFIDQGGTVNAQKDRWIQTLLQLL